MKSRSRCESVEFAHDLPHMKEDIWCDDMSRRDRDKALTQNTAADEIRNYTTGEIAKTRAVFEHDLPYMKEDIWEPGEIEKRFGHDPATYANPDHFAHRATVQFGAVASTPSVPNPPPLSSCVGYNGTICDANHVEDAADKAVDSLITGD